MDVTVVGGVEYRISPIWLHNTYIMVRTSSVLTHAPLGLLRKVASDKLVNARSDLALNVEYELITNPLVIGIELTVEL